MDIPWNIEFYINKVNNIFEGFGSFNGIEYYIKFYSSENYDNINEIYYILKNNKNIQIIDLKTNIPNQIHFKLLTYNKCGYYYTKYGTQYILAKLCIDKYYDIYSYNDLINYNAEFHFISNDKMFKSYLYHKLPYNIIFEYDNGIFYAYHDNILYKVTLYIFGGINKKIKLKNILDYIILDITIDTKYNKNITI
jgi:hypothetical protein